MPNRLASESSPYLLQHKDNPVEWYPWGEVALTRAKLENMPIFLSIGYSACHWCHVMEHESFENIEIATQLNEQFICIKVDREERPDLDQIYMNAIQIMTGRGGWPMSVFLTPTLKPFFGGTYWPPRSTGGMAGFDQIIQSVRQAWDSKRSAVEEQAQKLVDILQSTETAKSNGSQLEKKLLLEAATQLEQTFDYVHGGFGQAPKFPHSMDLQLLLRVWFRTRRPGLLDMVKLTLDKMHAGGMYDHLAGGFTRYSVDEKWLVPHFEKMLYDNALLTAAYLDGFLATGDEKYACVARETIDYVLKYMTDEQGGFHSTEDADSEGEEGKFYVWTSEEIHTILGTEAAERFCSIYDVSPSGNFVGRNILNLPKTIEEAALSLDLDASQLSCELAASRQKLLEVRDQRVRPGKDDKVLTSWNALMIDSLARAATTLGEPRYLDAATRAAKFILKEMRDNDGRLLHTWRHGQATLPAYLDDYAYFINALISLYEASFNEGWIETAVELADVVLKHFGDTDNGGFFFTADDHEKLIARNKDIVDASVPSGNAMAALALVRLSKLTGNKDLLSAAQSTLDMAVDRMERMPRATGQMLIALDMFVGPTHEIVVIADQEDPDWVDLLSDLRRHFIPNHILACRPRGGTNRQHILDPIFLGKQPPANTPVAYVCENFSCQEPAIGRKNMRVQWDILSQGRDGIS